MAERLKVSGLKTCVYLRKSKLYDVCRYETHITEFFDGSNPVLHSSYLHWTTNNETGFMISQVEGHFFLAMLGKIKVDNSQDRKSLGRAQSASFEYRINQLVG